MVLPRDGGVDNKSVESGTLRGLEELSSSRSRPKSLQDARGSFLGTQKRFYGVSSVPTVAGLGRDWRGKKENFFVTRFSFHEHVIFVVKQLYFVHLT